MYRLVFNMKSTCSELINKHFQHRIQVKAAQKWVKQTIIIEMFAFTLTLIRLFNKKPKIICIRYVSR